MTVGVLVGVTEGVTVGVTELVGVRLGVTVTVGVMLGVGVTDGVRELLKDNDGVRVGVTVTDGVSDGVFTSVQIVDSIGVSIVLIWLDEVTFCGIRRKYCPPDYDSSLAPMSTDTYINVTGFGSRDGQLSHIQCRWGSNADCENLDSYRFQGGGSCISQRDPGGFVFTIGEENLQ